jgi:type VI secretion system VasD/TssJ family lipoprotein
MIKRLVPALVLVLFLAACASQSPAPPDWTYEKDAVRLNLKADSKLNLDRGLPHTLVLCIYQLRDPNTFNRLSDNTEGIYKLLQGESFDSSAVSAKRVIVHPGQATTVLLDRAEGARYVGVAAGYYNLQKSRMIRLYDIPVAVESKGMLKKTQTNKPAPLVVDLELGATEIF